MVQPEVLQRKSLFSLLHTLDVELAEHTRDQRCPTVGGRCIVAAMNASLVAVPAIFRRSMPCV
jgi:hypothetical protein